VRKGIDFVSCMDGHITKDEIQLKCNYCFKSSDSKGHQSSDDVLVVLGNREMTL